jgi:hypothetical protein
MALIAAVPACSSKSNPVGPGGECFLAADCAPGLVCVEQPNKTRQCSDDLSRVAGRPPEEGGAADDGAAGEGGSDAPSDRVTPPADTGPRDTGTVVDTGPG